MTSNQEDEEPNLTTLKDRLLQSHSEMLEAELQGQADRTETAAATFNFNLNLAINRIKVIVQMTSIGSDETVESLAALTLAMLQVANQINVANATAFICNICGAVVERIQDDSLRSPNHCRALFLIVVKFLQYRQNCVQQDEPLRDVDGVLQNLCPPLMTFFARSLELLKELRDAPEATVLINSLPKSMIRMFLKQFVNETVLCAFVENKEEEKPNITFAQRITFTGLVRNHELAHWAISSGQLPSNIQDIGDKIEMDCWTCLHFRETWDENTKKGTHRIWQEGIPDDIAPLGDERIILFHAGNQSRVIVSSTTRVFPHIQLEGTLKGPPLEENELQELEKRIQEASKEDVIAALEHQQKRGGADDLLQSCIDQFASAESVD